MATLKQPDPPDQARQNVARAWAAILEAENPGFRVSVDVGPPGEREKSAEGKAES